MRIDGLSQQPKVPQTQQRSAPVRSRKGGGVTGDSVEIAASAPTVDELSAQARATSTDNSARIAEVRERVQSGYYSSRQAREQIADSMLESDGMREVVGDIAQAQVARQELAQIPDTRPDRVEQARQRASSGYYDTPQVRGQIADRVLDELA
jgi:anti-sigma28 factor (negative regulator of flagellin synthesis)